MLLLTGFEPFTTGEGIKLDHNPTADIVGRVASSVADVASVVLPVSYAKTKAALLASFEELRPRVWIGLGYAPHRTTVDLETIALNLEHAVRGDNDGERPRFRPIEENEALALRTRLDVTWAAGVFARHGVEAVPSFHAGTFLCNQVFYLSCRRCEAEQGLRLAAFIHVPPVDDLTGFEAGLTELVSAAVAGQGIDSKLG
jgi:pyroglutamyl-peptidase